MTSIAALDIETTGLLDPLHRIIEVYVGLYDLETKSLLRSFVQRINPERSISAEAGRVHGILLSDLIGEPIFADVAAEVRAIIAEADFAVAHNGKEFDLPFLNLELVRVGLEPLSLALCDTFLEGRFATPHGKAPSLREFCFACDVDYDPTLAHAAEYDVRVMMESWFKANEWGFLRIPDLAA